jgi:cell division protein FtsN
MARGDYAQRGSGGRSQTRPKGKGKSSGSQPGWIWMVLGLSFGLAIAALVYITRPAQPMPGQGVGKTFMREESAGSKQSVNPASATSKKEPIKLPPKEKPRFTFYDILPGQEVIVPDSITASAGKPMPGDDGLYVIQVAAYRTQEDADAQKARLALLGVESRIEKVTIDNKDTYYRVRVGPEKNLAKAHTLMARLEQNGVQAVLIKLK